MRIEHFTAVNVWEEMSQLNRSTFGDNLPYYNLSSFYQKVCIFLSSK